jgi:predicted metal-binding protein
MENLSYESAPPIFEIPREIFVLQPPLDLVIHSKQEVYDMCRKPYYKHPKGCPNYGKKESCPPRVSHITEVFDLSTIHFLIMKFDFAKYIAMRREARPHDTNRSLANQRHWQGHLRSQLRLEWQNSLQCVYPDYIVREDPEALGVNVVSSLANHGIDFDWCKEDTQHEFISLPNYMYHVFIFGQGID